jgi:hypothetical protein
MFSIQVVDIAEKLLGINVGFLCDYVSNSMTRQNPELAVYS